MNYQNHQLQVIKHHLRVQTSFEKIQEQEVDPEAQKVEQCIIDGNDYKDCVDRMVATMKSPVELENVTDAWYDEEGNLIP